MAKMSKKTNGMGSTGAETNDSRPVVVAGTVAPRRTALRFVFLGVVLLVVAAVGIYVWRAHYAKAPEKAATPQQKYQALDTNLQKQFDDGNYDQTIKDINDYLATDPPQEYVKQVTIQQAAAYLNTKDYPNALIWYRKTLDMSSTPFERMAALHGLAFTYEASGDKAAAIEQYKAAYAIAKPMSATNNQALRLATDDEYKIKRLGGSL